MKKLLNIDLTNFYKSFELEILIVIMVLLIYPMIIIARKIFRTKFFNSAGSNANSKKYIFEKNNLYSKLCLVLISLYLILCSEIIDQTDLASGIFIYIKNKIVQIYTVVTMSMMITTFINIGVDLYKEKPISKKFPIILHAQISKIIITCCAILAVMSTVLGLSISSLFASLGAATAIFALVFKDTVTGLIASLQVTYQDIIRVGDWIKFPKHNIEGDVEKVTITIVVIKNFDGTTSTVPTSYFLSDFVINNRLMFEENFRRIKRAINIDMDFIKICDQKLLDKISTNRVLQNFTQNNKELINADLGNTNLTLLRRYINYYLINNNDLHKGNYRCASRLLDPTSSGIPIEIYAFAINADFIIYENIQANIFEHILGILAIFELRAFQVETSIIPKV